MFEIYKNTFLWYSIHPKKNNFHEIFKQIKDDGKHMHIFSSTFPERYLLDLAVIICMYLWLASVLEL